MKTIIQIALTIIIISAGFLISCSSNKKAEPQPEVKQDTVAVEPQPEIKPEPVEKPKKKKVVEEEYVAPPTVYSLPEERTAGEIGGIINKHDSELKETFNTFKAKDPSLSGSLVIVATVSPNGKVVSTSVKQSTITDKSVERALQNRIRLWQFSEIDPKKGNQDYDIKYGFSR